MGIGVLSKTVGGGADFEAKRDSSDNIQYSSTGYTTTTTLTENNTSPTNTVQVNERVRFAKFQHLGSTARFTVQMDGNSVDLYRDDTSSPNNTYSVQNGQTVYASFTTLQKKYYESPTATIDWNLGGGGLSTTESGMYAYAFGTATSGTGTDNYSFNGSGSKIVWSGSTATYNGTGTGKIKVDGNTETSFNIDGNLGSFTKTITGTFTTPKVTGYVHLENQQNSDGPFGLYPGFENTVKLAGTSQVTAKIYPNESTTIT